MTASAQVRPIRQAAAQEAWGWRAFFTMVACALPSRKNASRPLRTESSSRMVQGCWFLSLARADVTRDEQSPEATEF